MAARFASKVKSGFSNLIVGFGPVLVGGRRSGFSPPRFCRSHESGKPRGWPVYIVNQLSIFSPLYTTLLNTSGQKRAFFDSKSFEASRMLVGTSLQG